MKRVTRRISSLCLSRKIIAMRDVTISLRYSTEQAITDMETIKRFIYVSKKI